MEPTEQTVSESAVVGGAGVTSVQYGGFWIRFLAVIIDGIIVGIVAGAISAIVHAGKGGSQSIQALLSFAYFTYLESSEKQATIGKQLLGLTVTDIQGNRLTFVHAVGRYLAKIVSGITLCIGFFMIGWTQKKQGLHDMIAKTVVIKKTK